MMSTEKNVAAPGSRWFSELEIADDFQNSYMLIASKNTPPSKILSVKTALYENKPEPSDPSLSMSSQHNIRLNFYNFRGRLFTLDLSHFHNGPDR
jgi:hypothetical protein